MRFTSRGQIALLCTLLCVVLVGCGAPGTIGGSARLPASVAPQPTSTPLPPITFPQDEAPHRDLTEWWYYTGHLNGVDSSGREHAYGFELTVFQTLRGQFPPFYAAHFAISDLTRAEFHYDQRVALGSLATLPPPGSTAGFDLTVGGWQVRGLAGHDALSAVMANYAIALQLRALKPPVLHNGDGIISYGSAGFSYYYSRPLIAILGTLTDHGTPVAVTGTAWMDHQWGNFVSLAGAGWDWYSIQLDNNTEYMLYIIRDSQKHPLSAVGTYVAPNGSAIELTSGTFDIQAIGSWTSPATGGVYPSGWHIRDASAHLSLALAPDLLDQELVTAQSTGVAYWEGTVRVRGTVGARSVSGQGYVELTGYATLSAGSPQVSIP